MIKNNKYQSSSSSSEDEEVTEIAVLTRSP
jgi:hypothetical protein